MKYLYVSLVSSFNKNNIKIIRMKIVYLLSYVHESTQEETAVLWLADYQLSWPSLGVAITFHFLTIFHNTTPVYRHNKQKIVKRFKSETLSWL